MTLKKIEVRLIYSVVLVSGVQHSDAEQRSIGFSGGLVVKSLLQCRRYRRHGFNPWVRKIPWRRAW